MLEEHSRNRDEAIKLFRTTRKMGGVEYSLQFLERLDIEIEEQYCSFLKVNNGKNLFKSMRTPAVLVAIMIFDYILQEMFQLIGLDTIAGFFSTTLLIAILALCVWAYSRYSGSMRDAGTMVDDTVSWAWYNFLSPLSQEGIHQAVVIGQKLAAMQNNSTRLASEDRRRAKKVQ
ncbi:hypothetical protein AB6A40_009138 [Gnathostoma spinigerum]|uniref:Uncharacterized protein n=1 Tax=Gnathostoma spinigerum TaxID=75299 RepID=A0ABD6EYV6_9BILA